MRRVTHVDSSGRKIVVEVPDGAPKANYAYGVRIGPPNLISLGLPTEQEIRLHNQLYERGLIEAKDVKGRMQDIFGALQAAFQVDSTNIVNLYRENG